MDASPRPEPEAMRRIRSTPTLGTAICLVIGAVLLAYALYLYLAPSLMPMRNGVASCGSALNPTSDKALSTACADVPSLRTLQSLLTAFLGLLIGGLGRALFGMHRTVEYRRADEPDAPHHA